MLAAVGALLGVTGAVNRSEAQEAGRCQCSSTFEPVCGANNVTYGNLCVADCQNVTVEAKGVCKDDESGAWILGASRYWQRGEVNASILLQFANEGFHYVYRTNLTSPEDVANISNVKVDPQHIKTDIMGGYRPGMTTSIRVTDRGHVYELVDAGAGPQPTNLSRANAFMPNATLTRTANDTANVTVTASSTSGARTTLTLQADASLPPPAAAAGGTVRAGGSDGSVRTGGSDGSSSRGPGEGGDDEEGSRRRLWTLGADDRRLLRDKPQQFPWQAAGQLSIKDEAGNSYTCTGALVGPSTVLTAAHCVYDAITGRYYKDVWFRAGLNAPETPYRPVRWKYATTYKEWRDRRDVNYDLALVTLQQPLGDLVGYLGYTFKCGPRNMTLTTVGYPSDKGALGSAYEQRCSVESGFDACRGDRPWTSETGPFQQHYCDSAMGQSGASMWDANYRVRMVLNAESRSCNKLCKNYGVLINPDHFQFIKRYAR